MLLCRCGICPGGTHMVGFRFGWVKYANLVLTKSVDDIIHFVHIALLEWVFVASEFVREHCYVFKFVFCRMRT